MTQLPKTQLMISVGDERGVHTEVGMDHVQVPTASSRKDLWDWRKPGNWNEAGSCPSGLCAGGQGPSKLWRCPLTGGDSRCAVFSACLRMSEGLPFEIN